MTRALFAAIIAALSLLPALPAGAFGEGGLTIKNATIDKAVQVDVREGGRVEDSFPAALATLKRGETLKLEATNLQFFWRREANPGSNDGKWTDWQRVDSRGGDQYVEF